MHAWLSRSIAVVVVLGCAAAASAQLTISASVNNARVRVGETVTLTIEADGAQSVDAPALGAIDGFNARYVGPSQQVSIVNGKISAKVQHRYALTALREGQFTIGPFDVAYEGQTYRTNPITLRVSAASAAPEPAAAGDGSSEPLRLTLAVDRPRVYLHERVPVDVTLYVGAVSARDLQYPALPADGLSVEEFGQPARSAEVIDGQRYEVLRFRTTVTPLKTGSLSLGPARTSLSVVRRPQNFFFTQRQPVELSSNAATLEVLPLPKAGRPASFTGAVGTFSLDVEASPTQVRVGDPITVRITLRGDGNLAQLQPPAYGADQGFKIYDAQLTDSSDDTTRVFEQVVIAETAESTVLPPLQFSFFDPAAEQYRTVASAAIPLTVEAPVRGAHRQIVSAGGVERRTSPEALGRDIVFIKDDPGAMLRARDRASRWWILLAWQPIPLVLYAAMVWYDRRRRRLSGDERYARATRAGRNARSALAKAEASLADEGFFDRLEKAVRSYLSAKLGLPPGAVDPQRLQERGLDADLIGRATRLLDACEHARYAPVTAEGDRRALLELGRGIVRDMERDRSLRPV